MRQPLAGRDAGVVDQRVDVAVLGLEPGRELGPAVGVGHVEVALDDRDVPAAPSASNCSKSRTSVAIDRRALGGQRARPPPRPGRAPRPVTTTTLPAQRPHQTGGATKTPLSGSLNESRAMISDIGSAVPHWSWVIGSAMS